MHRVMPKATSLAVTVLPFSNFTPGRIVNCHLVKVELGLPRSVARSGTRIIRLVAGSYLYCVSERVTRSVRIASASV